MLFIREIVFTRAVHLFIYHNNGLYKRIPIFLSNNGRYKRKSIYLIIYLTRNSFYLKKVVGRANLFIFTMVITTSNLLSFRTNVVTSTNLFM